MRGSCGVFIMFVAAMAAPACSAPMSTPAPGAHNGCHVADAAKLPAAAGGAQAVCREIERAIAAASPTTRYSADIAVRSSSRLSAVLVVNGRTLPEQNFAVSDRELNPESIRRFAEALASEVAKAAKE